MKKTPLLLVLPWLTGWAQDSLALRDAVHLALEKNKSMEASGAALKAAGSGVREARGGVLPKVNYSELWTRSDNPVFVFSSLLIQRQFGERNFQIESLNRPDFLNNFQSLISADQAIYDALGFVWGCCARVYSAAPSFSLALATCWQFPRGP